MREIRVLIADDHAVLRAGLRVLVEAQSDMKVVGEAADTTEALRAVRETAPDVVLLDLSMPGAVGAKAVEAVLKARSGARVLVLTMHDDPAYARAALAAGASGYVVKKAADTELLSAIRAVHRGRTFVDVSVAVAAPDLLSRHATYSPTGVPKSTLSHREQEVLQLLALGHTDRRIAERIGVAVKTVDTYRSRLARKLGLRTRADIVSYALAAGLLAPEKPSSDEA